MAELDVTDPAVLPGAPPTDPAEPPAPAEPTTATPVTPVPALDIEPPTPLDKEQQDGGSFYFRGRTERTATDNGAARTGEQSTTVEGGVTYGSGDRNGDGLTEHQLRVDGSLRNRTTTGADSTSTTTVEGSGSYTYTPSQEFKGWAEGGFTSTTDGTTRTTTTYGEAGIQGRFGGGQTERAARETGLDNALGTVYLDPEAARAQIEGADRGFEAGGQSFAQVAAALRANGGQFGDLSPAGLLSPDQVEGAVSAYAAQTQAAIDQVKARDPHTFERAVVYTQVMRDAFMKEFGDGGPAAWDAFQTTAERDGYAAAAAGLPPGASTSLRAGADALGAASQSFGTETMNAAEDQVSLDAYRATTSGQAEQAPSQAPSRPDPDVAPREPAIGG